MNERELAERLDDVALAEARLLNTVDSFGDEDLAAPSLLPRWTRGHVLAHVALNAHSLVNLFEWARTGVATPQYPSREERDADIERCATRSLADGAADWSDGFVREVLGEVPARLGSGAGHPFTIRATDLDIRLTIGDGASAGEVSGRGSDLLAWLLGRSDGSDLETDLPALPRVPAWG